MTNRRRTRRGLWRRRGRPAHDAGRRLDGAAESLELFGPLVGIVRGILGIVRGTARVISRLGDG